MRGRWMIVNGNIYSVSQYQVVVLHRASILVLLILIVFLESVNEVEIDFGQHELLLLEGFKVQVVLLLHYIPEFLSE